MTYCSHVIFLIPRVSPLPRGFLVFKMVPVSAPQGKGGRWGTHRYSGISEPLRVCNLTQCRTKKTFNTCPQFLGQHPHFYYTLYGTKDKNYARHLALSNLLAIVIKQIHVNIIAFVYLECKQILSSKIIYPVYLYL